jgi:DNA-binding Xre family transcriptional regulator
MKQIIPLKIYLMQNEITQTKLSDDTGLNKNTIAKLINTGHGSKATKELVRRYLELNLDEFTALLS